MLEHLLRCLAAQDTFNEFEYSVVVVDNDPQCSAQNAVFHFTSRSHLGVTYAAGAVNTIPAARNHALRLSHGNYIGIIDDDEFPPPDWLLTLYRAIRTFDVEGALGPVTPFFETRPPLWLVKGRFCERPVHRTGTLLNWPQTRTGNVLVKREVFDKYGLRFDETFTTGGSDQEFFKQAMSRGCRFVAVAEAPVYEVVSPERQTKSYWLRRAVVNGYNSARYSAGHAHSLTRLWLPVRTIGAVLLCAMALPFSALVGTHALVRCLERGGHHFSRLCAMIGIELIKKRSF